MITGGVAVTRGVVIAALASTVLRAGGVPIDVPGSTTVRGKPEANVVVWLEAPDAEETPVRRKIVLDQRNLQFAPRVLAIRTGTTVEFPNNDRVFHNVFSFRDGKRFDLGLYPIGSVKHVHFDKPGISRLFCNIHPQMAAYVIAVDSPYFAVSDGTGAFTLPNVPAGSYTYHAWRAGGMPLTGVLAVESQSRLEISWR
jgi:plastocyanin